MRALTSACRAVHSPHLLASLLTAVNESGWAEGALVRSLTARSVKGGMGGALGGGLGCALGGGLGGTQGGGLGGELALSVVELSVALMRRLPSASASKVVMLLALLRTWASANMHRTELDGVRESLKVGDEQQGDHRHVF